MKQLFLQSTNELEAFHSTFLTLYELNETPSDQELIKEANLSLSINNGEVNDRIQIYKEEFRTTFNYSTYLENGNEVAKIECEYWTEELFTKKRIQVLIDYLKKFPTSKRALVSLWDERHMDLDFPAACMVSMYCRIDNGKLNLVCNFRANDAYRNILIDLDMLRAAQQFIARELSLSVGSYLHVVDSLHLYKASEDHINKLYYTLKK